MTGAAPRSDARHLVVFDCDSCHQRIFAESRHLGRTGTCPLCGSPTVVASAQARIAAPAPLPKTKRTTTTAPSVKPRDRRRSSRVAVPNAQVAVDQRDAAGRVFSAAELNAVDDLSETGIGFSCRGTPDRKRITGFGPPAYKLGEELQVTLHLPELLRPRTLRATVRRVDPHATKKEIFRVGVEFQGPSDEELSELRGVVSKRAGSSHGTK